MPNESKRDIGNDILRGLAIICVVLIHTTAHWDKQFPENNIYGVSYSIFRPILTIWGSVFLFISGYYIGKTQINNPSDYWIFLKKRMSRILIPYVIWSTVLFIFGFFSGKYDLVDLPLGIMFGRLNYPYYFIPILVKFYLAYPIFYFLTKKRLMAISAFFLLSLLYIYAAIGRDLFGIKDFWVTGILFRKTIQAQLSIFFFAGILIQKGYLSSWTKINLTHRRILSLMFCAFTLGFSFVFNEIVVLFAMSLILFINSYISEKSSNSLTRSLAYLGERSYTIYLLHEPSLGLTSKFMRIFAPMLSSYPIIEQIPFIAVALGSPLMQFWILQKLIGSKARYIVG